MSYFEDALEKLKKSSIDELVELANDFEYIVELNQNYENLKINLIETGENLQADNPAHTIELNCNNGFIIGGMGTGKTTCYDKISHPFIAEDQIKSPIKNYVTDLKIEFKMHTTHNFRFHTSTSLSATQINIDEKKDPLKLLRELGLFKNHIIPAFFIPQLPENDKLFESDQDIEDFSRFSRYFYSTNEIKAETLFENRVNELNQKIDAKVLRKNKFEINFIENSAEIEKVSQKINLISGFINNYDLIINKLDYIKSNRELKKKINRRKKIIEEIRELRSRKEKLEKINEAQKITHKKHSDNVKELYIDYSPKCPECDEMVSLKVFEQRYQKKNCLLCGISDYEYSVQKITPIKIDEDIIPKKLKKNYKVNLNKLHDDLIEVNNEINDIKKSTDFSEKEVTDLMSIFYLDLNRPGFSSDEEYNREVELQKNKKDYLRDLKEKNKNIIQIIDDVEVEIVDLLATLEELNEIYIDFKIKVKKNILRFFDSFIESIKEFWTELCGEDKKGIEYFPDNKKLHIVSVHNIGTTRANKIESLRRPHGRISDSQLNALRYAIHLSLIKNLFKKNIKCPIRFILIDDPDKEFRDKFLQFLKKNFIDDMNFQVIIFSTPSDEINKYVKGGWKSINFEKNQDLEYIMSKNYQISLTKFLKERSEGD